MNEEEKQALIEWLRNEIKLIQSAQDEVPFGLDYDGEMALKGVKVALAALTAEPVAWEVKGIYCHSYEEAKSLYPNREPEPLFEKPEVQ